MKINYMKFMKSATKLLKGVPATRPVLKGVHHSEEGSLIATNSHVLYYVDAGAVNAPKNTIIDTVTGEEIDLKYPDTSKLIPDLLDATLHFNILDADRAIKALKAMLQTAKLDGKKDKYQVVLKEHVLQLRGIEDVNFRYILDEHVGTDTYMILNIEYLIDALEMFKDQGFTNLTVYLFGNQRPLVIVPTLDHKLKALILPIRDGGIK